MEFSHPVFAILVGFTANVLSQLFLFRLRFTGLIRSELLGFAIGLFVMASLIGRFGTYLSPETFLQFMIYGGLGYCYFHWINLCETARRIRILLDIHHTHDRGLPYNELAERYNAETMLEFRLNRLLNTGQITLDAKGFHIQKKTVLRMAQTIQLFRRLLKLPTY